jgi:rRNA maturation endonuclease Nob1
MVQSYAKIGERNRYQQILLQKTNLAGTILDQKIWRLRCETCNREYGANGSEFDSRKCPGCQRGPIGLRL